jgi:hypothetical protein
MFFIKKAYKQSQSKWANGDVIDSDFEEEVEGMMMPPVDEAIFIPRPPEAETTYLEEFGQHRADEQLHLHNERGEVATQPHRENLAGFSVTAEDDQFLIDGARNAVADARERHGIALRVLGHLRCRNRHERWFYFLRMAVLVGGDVVGVAGGLIMLGEVPWLAVMQALAAGAAAITSGLMAAPIKEARLARTRKKDPEDLTADEQLFSVWFQGPDSGELVVKVSVYGALTIIPFLFVGILALRMSTEGTIAGLVFGCIAVAVALASWASCYYFTDPVADLLESMHHDFLSARKELDELNGRSARASRARAETTVTSLLRVSDLAGKAARERVLGGISRRLSTQPGIVGQGRGNAKVLDLTAPEHSNGNRVEPDPESAR